MDSIPDAAECAFGLFDVTRRHAGRDILRDVSLAILPGEFHALAGSKNSGKTAICSVLAGELQPDAGRIRLGGRDCAAATPRLARQAGVSVVNAVPRVFPGLTVGENLLSGESLWRRALRSWRGFLGDLKDWLDAAGLDLQLSQQLEHLPAEDWIFIETLGRLYRKPRLLIMDEALESLSPPRRKALLPVLRREMADGMSLLWVTHKLEDALVMVDRLSVVRNGRILITTPPGGIDQLGLINLCYSQVEEVAEVDVTMHQFRQLMRYTGALIRDLPQAVAILDREGETRFINRKAGALFTGGGAAWRGRSLAHLLGDGNADLRRRVGAAMAEDREAEWHNVPVRHNDGEMLSDVTLRRIIENAACVGYMVLVEDVSAREELRRRVILSDNLASVGLLAAGVAHEVNNPLEIIGNYLTFLKKQAGDDDVRRVVGKVEEESARIQQIVNNLIVYSGNSPAASALVDLPALCLELCELLRFHNKDKRISLSCRHDDPDVLVRADPNEMRQVFLNLFRNSITAIGVGGRIDVEFTREVRGDGACVVMRFSDNGPGIALKKPDDIFLPFVTTRNEGGKNHGLGLFIVFGIVEKYGGTITVANLPAGGCCFTVTLPLAAAD